MGVLRPVDREDCLIQAPTTRWSGVVCEAPRSANLMDAACSYGYT